jgi:copper chaperone NosL
MTMLLAGSVLVLGACGDDNSADDPPEISYGEDVCDRCHMIINDERYSAGLRTEDDEELLFDDTGEMIAYIQEESLTPRRVWVHDFETGDWTDGEKAFFVHAMMTATPMGTGITAFAERSDADAFAAANEGTVMDWTTVVAEWKMQDMGH